jgi:hypothetical protein
MFLKNMKPNYSRLLPFKQYPFHKFTFKKIGVNIDPIKHQEFLLSYNNMPIDPYMNNDYGKDVCLNKQKKIHATRLRRFAKFNVIIHPNHTYDIFYNHNLHFSQEVDDSRNKIRIFDPIESKFLKEQWLLQFITQMTANSIINHIDGNKIKRAEVSLHQVRQISYPGFDAFNSPEGVHRDGADFIVSAMVMNRLNVSEGKTIIFNEYRDEIYNTILEKGEGVFQEDRKLWHYVTGIKSQGNYLGIRDILGLDIILK